MENIETLSVVGSAAPEVTTRAKGIGRGTDLGRRFRCAVCTGRRFGGPWRTSRWRRAAAGWTGRRGGRPGSREGAHGTPPAARQGRRGAAAVARPTLRRSAPSSTHPRPTPPKINQANDHTINLISTRCIRENHRKQMETNGKLIIVKIKL